MAKETERESSIGGSAVKVVREVRTETKYTRGGPRRYSMGQVKRTYHRLYIDGKYRGQDKSFNSAFDRACALD